MTCFTQLVVVGIEHSSEARQTFGAFADEAFEQGRGGGSQGGAEVVHLFIETGLRSLQFSEAFDQRGDEGLCVDVHLLQRLGVGGAEHVLHHGADLRHALSDLVDFLCANFAFADDLREGQHDAVEIGGSATGEAEGIAHLDERLLRKLGADTDAAEADVPLHRLFEVEARELRGLA